MQPTKHQKGFNFTPYSESDDIDSEMELEDLSTYSTIQPILVGDFKLENNSGLSDLFNQIDTEADTFKDGLSALIEAVDDAAGTDPLNLMPLFSVTEWRYKLSDLLMSLSIWIDPD